MDFKPTTDLAFVAFMLRNVEAANSNKPQHKPSGRLLIALSALDKMFKGK